ncbi:GH23607 [Drosophila grimshawi]|uniref:GH23607 n=1 Tax=Drosophila grimshawi TaxID=7222 RepID=B4K0P2_DROGR|nr:GH23607 [Drosophila grimshawi]
MGLKDFGLVMSFFPTLGMKTTQALLHAPALSSSSGLLGIPDSPLARESASWRSVLGAVVWVYQPWVFHASQPEFLVPVALSCLLLEQHGVEDGLPHKRVVPHPTVLRQAPQGDPAVFWYSVLFHGIPRAAEKSAEIRNTRLKTVQEQHGDLLAQFETMAQQKDNELIDLQMKYKQLQEQLIEMDTTLEQ